MRALAPTLCLLVSACATPPPAAPAPSEEASIGAQLDALVETYAGSETPALAMAVMRDGEVLATSVRGLANLEHQVPATPRTRFHVASVSKQFTAYATYLLAECGVLSVSDRVGDHLADLPAIVADITIEQLIHHTSGLRQTMRLQAVAGRRYGRLLQQGEAMDLVRAHRELNHAPGEEYLYSNTGYIVLAAIIEAKTEQRFADWMQAEVFQPAGLQDTLIVDDYATIVPRRARSYSESDESPTGFRHDSGLFWYQLGGTAVHTTIEDLARWTLYLMEPPTSAAAVVRAMTTPGTLNDGSPIQYAGGLFLDEHRGLQVIDHGGEGDGMCAYAMWFPEVRAGAVLLENAPLAHSGLTARAAADLVLDTIEGVRPLEDAERMLGPDESLPPIDDALRQRVTGRYLVDVASAEFAPEIIRIEAVEEGLLLHPPTGGRLPLALAQGGQLVGQGMPLQLEIPEGEGPVQEIVGQLPGRALPLRRLDGAPARAPKLDDHAYAGAYFSPEVNTTFDVSATEDGLLLRHDWHGELALEHIHGDTFDTRRSAIRWIHFVRDEADSIVGFRLTNSNQRVRRLWFERTDRDRE